MNVFEELKSEDYKILKELDLEDPQKVMEIYAKRIALYKKFADRIRDPIAKEIIYTKREIMMNSANILNTQQSIQLDVANITSRLDDLESKLFNKIQ